MANVTPSGKAMRAGTQLTLILGRLLLREMEGE